MRHHHLTWTPNSLLKTSSPVLAQSRPHLGPKTSRPQDDPHASTLSREQNSTAHLSRPPTAVDFLHWRAGIQPLKSRLEPFGSTLPSFSHIGQAVLVSRQQLLPPAASQATRRHQAATRARPLHPLFHSATHCFAIHCAYPATLVQKSAPSFSRLLLLPFSLSPFLPCRI